MNTKGNSIGPDFLIVGVAKCGSTSLANYLDQHKLIAISKQKEPRYLTYPFLKDSGYRGPGDHIPKKRSIKDKESYEALFRNDQETVLAGEASVDTIFYHRYTVDRIKEELGEPRIIILLRDPVKRAISAYAHLVREERETLSFEEALEKERERLDAGYEHIWGYVTGGLYATPVNAFLSNFKEVKVVIFEDLVQHTQETVADITAFLGVSEHTFSGDQHNRSGRPKFRMLNLFLTRRSIVKDLLKNIFGKQLGVKVKNKIQQHNLESIEVSMETKQKLYKTFEKDIELIEQLLNRNLDIWKKPYV